MSSKIEWTNETWNIITGCSIASAGCKNCYAMREAGAGRVKNHPSRIGLTKEVKGKHVWTGELRFNEDWLLDPYRWRKPRRIFVCAAGDLFHENGRQEWLDLIYGIMALSPQHQFQVLTKRADIMRAYVEKLQHRAMDIVKALVEHFGEDKFKEKDLQIAALRISQGPLEQIWHGVSAEDQATADERIADLLWTPSAVHWVSYEPALGGINFSAVAPTLPAHKQNGFWIDAMRGKIIRSDGAVVTDAPGRLDWIVAGGESGSGARPTFPGWFYELRDECLEAGVAFNFKQWGNWRPKLMKDGERMTLPAPDDKKLAFIGPEGNRLNGPGMGKLMERVAKKEAGRLLEGRIWDEYPRELPS